MAPLAYPLAAGRVGHAAYLRGLSLSAVAREGCLSFTTVLRANQGRPIQSETMARLTRVFRAHEIVVADPKRADAFGSEAVTA